MFVSSTEGDRSNRHTFRSEERLKSKSLIAKLFNEGHSFVEGFIKVTWLELPLDTKYPMQTAFIVSSKTFKKAVDRNKIKRRMREAFRTQKNDVYTFMEKQGTKCGIIFIYIEKDIVPFVEIEAKINLSLNRFKIEYAQASK